MPVTKLLLVFILVCSFIGLSALVDTPRLVNSLGQDGFTRVAVYMQDDTLVITYQNNCWRNSAAASYRVLQLASECGWQGNISLVPLYLQTPLIKLITNKSSFDKFVEEGRAPHFCASILTPMPAGSGLWQKGKQNGLAHNGYAGLDLIFNLDAKAKFGAFDDPIKAQVNITPGLEIPLWNGARMWGELIVPVYNEFHSREGEVRPGMFGVSQLVNMPGSVLVNLTAGYFTQDRFGFDAEVFRYISDLRASVGLVAGYTGFLQYEKATWYYEDPDTFTWLANAAYYPPWLNLKFKAAYGRWLNKDYSLRFDVSRRFGEIELGFYAVKGEYDDNGGFFFSLPLYPAKYSKRDLVRIRPANSFSWEYRLKGYHDDGLLYRTRKRIDNLVEEFLY